MTAVAVVLLSAGAVRPIHAQAWAYPAFQPPRVTVREFNFAVADASHSGTTLLFQWREEMAANSQLSLDLGIADPEFRDADLLFLIGGQYARQLARSSADMPLDFLFTVGAFLAIGDETLFRLPAGVSIGHRFPLEGELALTPYVHPRVSLDICGSCRSRNDTDLNLNFDLGLNFELTRTLAIRANVLLEGSDNDGFGIGLAWTPQGLVRRAVR